MLHRDVRAILDSCDIDPFASGSSDALLALAKANGLEDQLRIAGESPGDLLRLILSMRTTEPDATPAESATEFVATLPDGVATGTRPTGIVVDEICRNARFSLLLMGYQIRVSSGIHEHLNSAAARGVAVTLVCDREDTGWASVVRDWLPGTTRPRVLTNPPGATPGQIGKMHCKVLCADGNDLLITSANFTWTGHNANIEYGVRLIDPKSAQQAQAFVKYLESARLLVDRESER